jgi:hypothetical protein
VKYLELVLKVLRAHGSDELVSIWGWTTSKSQDLMYRVGKIRKSNCFAMVGIYEALIKTLKYEYQQFLFANQKSTNDYPIKQYIQDGCRCDVTFSNYINLLFDIFLPQHLILSGLKENNIEKYNCGRVLLLPLMAALNSRNYGPKTVREFFIYYEMMPPAVRDQYKTFLTFNGKPLDDRQEESNLVIQLAMSNGPATINTINKAMTMLMPMRDCMKAVMDAANIKQEPPRKRTNIDQSGLTLAISRKMVEKGIFKNLNRTSYFRLDGKQMRPDNTVKAILDHGRAGLISWTKDFLNGKQPRWPTELKLQY